MPLGKYPDFASCLRAQMKKGHSKEAAGGICGLIEKRHKAKHELGDVVKKQKYANSNECMADMMNRGHTQDDARMMCRNVTPRIREDALTEEEINWFLGITSKKKVKHHNA